MSENVWHAAARSEPWPPPLGVGEDKGTDGAGTGVPGSSEARDVPT